MKKFLLSLLVALSLFQAFMPMAQARGWGPRVEVFEIRETYHYHNGPRTQVIYWGQSTFYYDPSIGLYANHYTQQTIRDFVSLCAYNGLRTVHLIPHGQKGAIPPHLKSFTYHEFNRYGINVIDQPGKKIRKEQKALNLFLEMMENLD